MKAKFLMTLILTLILLSVPKVFALVQPAMVQPPSTIQVIDAYLESNRQRLHIPGLAVAITTFLLFELPILCDMPLPVMLFFQPDLIGIAVISVALSIVWGLLRTGFSIWLLVPVVYPKV